MDLPQFRERYQLQEWPLCLFAACGELQSAVGNFITIFFAHLKREFELQEQIEEEKAAAAASLRTPSGAVRAPVQRPVVPSEYACTACTFINPWDMAHCAMCGADRPTLSWTFKGDGPGSPRAGGGAAAEDGGLNTLESFFREVEQEYWHDNSAALQYNKMKRHESREYHSIGEVRQTVGNPAMLARRIVDLFPKREASQAPLAEGAGTAVEESKE